jgi:BsuBI/PstI restriction endonuclease domain/BsuBI/PstI restriction endonuclease HTH domain
MATMPEPHSMPPYATKELVRERLPLIFPEGTPNRSYCIRDVAASTVFTMLYIGAVEGSGRFLSPKHVYRMTRQQAAKTELDARHKYGRDARAARGARWYQDNSREAIRDETLREGLLEVGAAVARGDVPTTSSKPRYALRGEFAALFNSVLESSRLEAAIAAWQATNLSPGALARVAIMRHGAGVGSEGILVTFPNGETRQLALGPSAPIAKAVIEVFAKSFLEKPAVLWLSESGNKVVARDDRLAAKIGLKIRADRDLPDAILVDLGPMDPLIVFIEIVATDGAITPRRQRALQNLSDEAGFKRSQVTFVTAYQDRDSAGFKKTISILAWNSFAWFVSEPEKVVILHDGMVSLSRLADLIGDRALG